MCNTTSVVSLDSRSPSLFRSDGDGEDTRQEVLVAESLVQSQGIRVEGSKGDSGSALTLVS